MQPIISFAFRMREQALVFMQPGESRTKIVWLFSGAVSHAGK